MLQKWSISVSLPFLTHVLYSMLSHSVMSDSLWPPWTVAHQAPSKNAGVGCHALLLLLRRLGIINNQDWECKRKDRTWGNFKFTFWHVEFKYLWVPPGRCKLPVSYWTWESRAQESFGIMINCPCLMDLKTLSNLPFWTSVDLRVLFPA